MMWWVGNILSSLSALLQIPLSLAKKFFMEGMKMTISYHKFAIAYSREAGMSLQQAQSYTKVLSERAVDLGNKYGIAAEAVKELERNLANATGRAMLLSQADTERLVQINKIVGDATQNRFSEEIIRGMGGQLETMEGAISRAYATAAKNGLYAKGFAEKVAQNLGMANKLSFRDGINGLIRMTAMSEKLGINMQAVESAANQFLEIGDAIEHSAQMQMLGGSAAVAFGNPLTAAYEANYDPESFAKRLSDSLASYAQYDSKTGMARINGMNMDFVRSIAKAMGISADEAAKMAKKEAEVRYKNNVFGTDLDRIAGNRQDVRDMLLNKSYMRDNKLYITDSQGKERSLKEYASTEDGKKEMERMTSLFDMDDSELMAQQASTLISIDERIAGIMTSLTGKFSEKLVDILPKIQDLLQRTGNWLIDHADKIADNIKKLANSFIDNVPKIVKWFEDHGGLFTKMAKGIETITSNWPTLIATILAAKTFGWAGGGLMQYAMYKRALNAASGAGKGSGAVAGAGGRGGSGPRGGRQGGSNSNTGGRGGSGPRGGRSVRQIQHYQNNAYRMTNSPTGYKAFTNSYHTGTRNGLSRTEALRGASKAYRTATSGTARILKGGIAGGAASGILSGILLLCELQSINNETNRRIEEINKSNMSEGQKRLEIERAELDRKKERFGASGGAIGGLAAGAAAGAALGSVVPVVGNIIGGIIGGALGYMGGKAIGKSLVNDNLPKYSYERERYATGGMVSGGKPGIDTVPALLTNGERVLNPTEAKMYNKWWSDVKAKPVGGKEYIYIPNGSTTSNVNGNNITVDDINVKINGTIKLESNGVASKDIDIRQLLNDNSFVNSLKEMIKESINYDMNGGRYLNDISTRRGQVSSSSFIGKG